jgi:electron transfer flavoprotein alpha subunit
LVASIYGPDEEKSTLWIVLEHEEGKLASISLELLTKGRELADEVDWPLIGLLLGHQIKPAAEQAFAYGADEVWIIDHPLLSRFSIEAHAHAATEAILQGKPSVLLFGATPNSRDLAGRLAVRLRTGLNADCTNLHIERERGILTSEVTGFGGGVIALLEIPRHRPQMATVRPGVFKAGQPNPDKAGILHETAIELPEAASGSRTLEHVVGEGVDLTQAQVLVCGGRGVAGNFEMLQELAGMLEGEVGATRPPVDEGHIERERQIGQTGVIGHPKLAFACGISGAFHFVVGIQDADTVIAINSDPEAPIFEFADYCIVGDVARIIPALIQALDNERDTRNG